MNGVQFHRRWLNSVEEYRRIQAMEMRSYRKIRRISYKDHATDEEVRAKIQQAIGLQEDLLTIVFGSPAQLVTKRQNNACFATSVISMSIALVLSKAATTPVQKTTNTCDV